MLGPRKRREGQLFYVGFRLEDRVPADHPLREVLGAVDFSFVRREVAGLYGDRGNESVDPIVVLKLLFLKFFYNVGSTRELLRDMPMRLDWMWFCEFDLTDAIPDHSVVSKARKRWGREVFCRFFERVLRGCVEAGLVGGEVVHVDASVNLADASMESIRTRLRLACEDLYDDEARSDGDEPGARISTTDPDARLTRKNGRAMLGYKDHRVVDDRCGIVTATITTPAHVSEPHVLGEALDLHEANTGSRVRTGVADRQYGTAKNYRELRERGVIPCIPHKRVREDPSKLPRRLFVYDAGRDRYTCPAGQTLTRRARSDGGRWRYGAAAGVCDACALRSRCTDSSRGRTISRQADQDAIDWADACHSPSQRRRLMGRRRAKIEGSFADAANRHGAKRMRWRGLESAAVQHLLIATTQNIRKLIKRPRRTPTTANHATANHATANHARAALAAIPALAGILRSRVPSP